MILNRLCQLACRIMMEVYVCKRSQLHLSPFRWSHGLPLEKSWLLVFLDSTWRICLYLFLFFPLVNGEKYIRLDIFLSDAVVPMGCKWRKGPALYISTSDACCISWHLLTKWLSSTALPLPAMPLLLKKFLPTQGSRGRKEIWQFFLIQFYLLPLFSPNIRPRKRIIF